MSKPLFTPFYSLFLIFLLLTACSTTPPMQDATTENSIEYQDRMAQMANMNTWQITGKIAFIQKNKRESATLFWQVDEINKQQTLNLTTVLGINVLQLKSDDGLHTLTVDGNTYHTQNLDQLIFELTALQIPTVALIKWIKGIQYSPSDQLTFATNDFLPTKLISDYNEKTWQINYQKYKQINQYQLASSLVITQDDFSMKLLINEWKIQE